MYDVCKYVYAHTHTHTHTPSNFVNTLALLFVVQLFNKSTEGIVHVNVTHEHGWRVILETIQ
jgi:hypothetical protein